MIRKLLILGLASYVVNKVFERPQGGLARARTAANRIRQAGPSEMRDPPRNWDMTDERLDESFPASDPPGKY